MALWLRDITLNWEEDVSRLPLRVAAFLNIDVCDLNDFRVVRRALDARRKPHLLKVFTVEFSVADEAGLLRQHAANPRLQAAPTMQVPVVCRVDKSHRAVVVGMGPAGLFAARRLAECGVRVTLIDRGRPVEQRIRDVERFWALGELDPSSNVQFGEGGAGTFSDGKLSTRLNHPWLKYVLATLVSCGAPEEILVEAKPHIGTDRLRRVLIEFRRQLQALGVMMRYESCLTDLEQHGGRITAGIVNGNESLECDSLVMAPGHSARDTYRMLVERGVACEKKDFAVGVRVEHPAELIARSQYGRKRIDGLPAAEYVLRYNDAETGRGVYSFCMCPGGEIINASSEPGAVVVNGMSRSARDGSWSNSALVVTVHTRDWEEAGLLGGMAFQESLERAAFCAGGGSFFAPAQNLLAFLGQGHGPCQSTCRPGVREADLAAVLPGFVTACLRRALPKFDRQLHGFLSGEAVLIGVETRTSAPLRIVRSHHYESLSHQGLYPAGEGAGYAGGIMSAALDGLRVAEQIIQQLHEGRTG